MKALMSTRPIAEIDAITQTSNRKNKTSEVEIRGAAEMLENLSESKQLAVLVAQVAHRSIANKRLSMS